MFDTAFLSGFPLDVYSRLQSLFFHVRDVSGRVNGPLGQLVNDYEGMAIRYIEATKAAFQAEGATETLKYHEMVDTLTAEWHTITELIATVELGRSYLGQFEPYILQASEDIGITDIRDHFLLIPTFGKYFALTSFKYSTTQLSMMKLPLSAITSPWEWGVIWHELAGLKVKKARGLLREHLESYAKQKGISLTDDQDEEETLFKDLFDRILNGSVIDGTLRSKLQPFLKRRLGKSRSGGGPKRDRRIWSLDWLEQLFEDACSVLAFGDDLIFVFEKILGRESVKLKGDRRHPDLATRVTVAKRLLALKNNTAGKPADQVERLTDELLWNFLINQAVDSPGYLPLVFESPEKIPALRKDLMNVMGEYRKAFGSVSPYPDPLMNLVSKFLPGNWNYTSSERKGPSIEQTAALSSKLFDGRTLDDLVNIELSDTDLLVDIRDHTHGTSSPDSHENMSIKVHDRDHTIYGWFVSHS